MAKNITYFAVPGLPLIHPGDDLAALIVDALRTEQLQLISGDIVVVAQKVISKAENRYVELRDVHPSQRAQISPIRPARTRAMSKSCCANPPRW
jgi:coenzyme F420-0:L-glutamate ligase/coenzyme F420-1:gamma-L-glutamate ligase